MDDEPAARFKFRTDTVANTPHHRVETPLPQGPLSGWKICVQQRFFRVVVQVSADLAFYARARAKQLPNFIAVCNNWGVGGGSAVTIRNVGQK